MVAFTLFNEPIAILTKISRISPEEIMRAILGFVLDITRRIEKEVFQILCGKQENIEKFLFFIFGFLGLCVFFIFIRVLSRNS